MAVSIGLSGTASMVTTSANAAALTAGSLSAAIPEHWIRRELTNLPPDLVMIDIARDSGPNAWLEMPVHKGTIVNFWRYPVLAANASAVSEGAAYKAAISADLIAVSAQVAEYYDYMVFSDLSDAVALKRARDMGSRMMAQQGVRTFDAILYAAAKAGGTAAFATDGAGVPAATLSLLTSSHKLTQDALEYLAYTFKNAKVRFYPNGHWKYKAHPYTVKDLRAQTGTNDVWEIAKYLRDEELLRGAFVGRVSNFDIVETTEITSASASASTSAYARHNIAAGYEGLGAISLGAGMGGKPNSETGQLAAKPHWQANMRINFEGPGGISDPARKFMSVAQKMCTVAKVLDAARIYTHYCYAGT